MAEASRTRFNVYVRWRPLTESEADEGQIFENKTITNPELSLSSISVKQDQKNLRPWTSSTAFKHVFNPQDDNTAIYGNVVASAVPQVLEGKSCNVFAYGHSGSGKTHTIVGYDFTAPEKRGLCIAASKQLFEALDNLQGTGDGSKFGIGLSLFELRRKVAFDLLNERTECHIREGSDGKVHIRGETEVLEGGKVRVQPLTQRACWTYEALLRQLEENIGKRAVGSSTVHDQSSRTHLVLKLEIINRELIDARCELIDRESELVPVGKRATDISIEEQMKVMICNAEGVWVQKPGHQLNQERIDEAEAEKAKYEAKVTAAQEKVESIPKSSKATCLGGKMMFVDLAGAEYHDPDRSRARTVKQSPQEQQEGRQINTDLLALKEVIRAWSTNQARIPFRNSPLTMVLREHFLGSKNGSSSMIVAVSPAMNQYSATLNSLKYGSLVGAAGL
ncbi:P-loop containing nucleoside triphosphate hydrolase protein [Hypomontagnella monticulosa]|nr:P-loop containing nucleoside triphosphate hydrolase protein [Hypomontagnella monticulosa]